MDVEDKRRRSLRQRTRPYHSMSSPISSIVYTRFDRPTRICRLFNVSEKVFRFEKSFEISFGKYRYVNIFSWLMLLNIVIALFTSLIALMFVD